MPNVRCPGCGRETAISDALLGAEVTCTACQEPYIAGSIRAGQAAPESPISSATTAPYVRPRNIGGWLVLPAIGLLVGPLLQFSGIMESLAMLNGPDVSALESRFPGFHMVLSAEVAASGGLLALQLFAALCFFRKKANTPKVMVLMYSLGLFVEVILAQWTAAVVGEMPREVASNIARSVIVAAIWIPYFLISRRVKATFVIP